MSNFLPLQTNHGPRVWLPRTVGGVGGLFISLLFIFLQEQIALGQSLALAQEKAQVQMNLTQDVTLLQGNDSASMTSTTSANVAPSMSALEMRQRLHFLASRQTERQSLSEVQNYLLQGRAHHIHAKVQLKLLEWQDGKMVWEGYVTSAQNLAPLHQQLLTFSNWQEAPTWPQFQWVAPTTQAVTPDVPRYAFRMQAQLKSSLNAVPAVQKPQEMRHE
jgi:hypothetical protein